MWHITKTQACELDSKIRTLRKKATTFACGYVHEDPSKLEPCKEFIAASRDSLKEIESHCLEFTAKTDELERLLVEAGETADKVSAKLSELYANYNMEMPTIEDAELPIGIPLNLIVEHPKTADESSLISQDVTNDSKLGHPSEPDTDEEFKPNVYISRPSGTGGPPTYTPLIKAMNKSKI